MSRIAIIGMAGRFPGAASVSRFWEVLRNGVWTAETLSTQELRSNGVSSAHLASPRYIRVAATLDGYDAFDAARFGYSPREAKLLDPQHRVFLETCLTALEDAGVAPHRDGRVGMFAGAGGNLRSYANAFDLRGETASLVHVSTDKDFLAPRVSFELGLTGPSLGVQTSTSSSLVALHLACRSLLDGECDVAVAGGVTVRIPHRVGYLFEEGAVLSADGVCRPFSSGANGTVFGNGVGVIVLKRLEDAVADGDRIRAVVLGSAVGHDGGTKDSFTISSAAGVARVMEQAFARAAVDARSVGLVEAHATGTVVGDPIEFAGLSRAFSNGAGGTGIGSVKGNVGHLEAAAGITSVIKAVLSLENQLKPKTVGVTSPNPALGVEVSPFRLLQEAEPWSAHDGPRRAAVSSLGLGGTNAAVVLEEATSPPRTEVKAERPWHVLTLSATSQSALARQAQQAAADLRSRPDGSLGDACYTANVGRGLLAHRVAVAGSSAQAIAKALDAGPPWSSDAAPDAPALVTGTTGTSRPIVAFLFSGQGQQRLGMARELFETLPSFRANLLACDALMRKRSDGSLVDILFGSDDARFQRPPNLQPIFFSVQYALAKVLLDWGVVPSVGVGHSLGEYAAGCIAGAFSLEDAFDLVFARGRLLDRPKGETRMATVFAPGERVARAVARFASTVGIAGQNSHDEWVISGESRDVEAIARELEPEGVRVRTFDIGFAAHSPALDRILDQLEAAAQSVVYQRELRFPIVSTLTGRLAEAGDLRSAKYWRNHAREMVRAASALEALYDFGANVLVEIGPSPTFLSAAMLIGAERGRKDVLGLPALSRKQPDWRRLLETLSALHVRGVDVDWKAFDRDFDRRKVSFPTYAFERQRFSIAGERDDEPRSLRVPTSPGAPSLGQRGRRIHSPALRDHVYERELQETGLTVFGVPLVSFRFFVELTLEAAASTGGRSTVLNDVSFLEPLVIPSGARRHLQTIVRPNAARSNIEIFSATHPDEDWALHCKAAFGASDTLREISTVDVAAARSAADRRDGVVVYQDLEERGFLVHNDGRCIRQMWRSADGAVVEISERVSSLSPLAAIAVSLDAAGHALHSILKSEEDRSFLPLGFQSLEVHHGATSPGPVAMAPPASTARPSRGASADAWFATVAIRETAADGSTVTADISLVDQSGRRVASLAGYCLREVDRSVLVAQGRELSEWSYEVAWEVQDARFEQRSPPALELSTWLVVGDDPFAAAVASAMEDCGATVLLVDDIEKLAPDLVAGAHGIVNLLPSTVTADDPLERAIRRACKSTTDIVHLATGGGAAATPPRLIVVTRGGQPVLGSLMVANQAIAWGMMRTLKAEHPGLRSVCLDLDPHAPDHGLATLLATLATTDGETQVAVRRGRRHVARLVRNAPSRRRVAVPSEVYRANLRLAGQLDNVVFTPAQREAPGPNQVEIAAQAHGLSFRDVLTALGVVGARGGLGLECAGVVASVGEGVSRVSVGDSVMALAPTQLGSHVIADERLVARIPPMLSFEQAAAIPLAFVLAWHLVHDVARVKAGQRVLVHAASGAVGQAIVQVALAAGATVLGTASLTKQRALGSMSIERVFSSRSQDFDVEVLAHTEGAGVDAVFHSLQPRFLAASARCLQPEGLLVDLSVGADADDVDRLGLSRRYVRFDLLEAIEQRPGELGAALHRVLDALSDGTLSPIASTVFAVHDLATALGRLVSPKHFGKVVIASQMEPLSSVAPRGAPFTLLDTYIVAGGAADEREALAAQLRDAGAGRVVRVGVSNPSDVEPTTADDIRVDASNVGDGVSMVIRRHPRTRGIFVLQGAARAGLEDWANLSKGFVDAATFAVAIDQASRDYRLPLDFFVLHSSIASTIGIPGAAQEAILASYLDGLAHARRASGLPATAIDWGGAPAERGKSDPLSPHWARVGVENFTPSMAFAAMASMLSDPPAQAAILPIRWESVARKQPALRGDAFLGRLFLESADPRRRSDDVGRIAAELRDAPPSERLFRLTEFIEASVVRTLGLRTSQRLDPQGGFRDLGLDSLLAVELRNRLQEALDLRLPQGITFNYPNLTSLSEFIASKLFAVAASPGSMPKLPTSAPSKPVVTAKDDDLASLGADELERLLRAELLGVGD